MSSHIHFLNGAFVSEDELRISPRDLGYTRGYAVADFIVTRAHKPFKLPEHVDRLLGSAEIIGLQIPWSKKQIIDWANETLDRNMLENDSHPVGQRDPKNNNALDTGVLRYDQAGDEVSILKKKTTEVEKTLKIIISGGVSHSLHQAKVPTLVMMVDDRKQPPQTYYEQGVKAITAHYKRPYPEGKHTHYVEAIRQLAAHGGNTISEVIYYDDTQVFEGAGCNLFAVIDNVLVTPKTNIVAGITRNTLLEILRLPIPVVERDFAIQDLQKATEVFLTGSNAEVRGVVEIDGNVVGDGEVGDITKEAAKQYSAYVPGELT